VFLDLTPTTRASDMWNDPLLPPPAEPFLSNRVIEVLLFPQYEFSTPLGKAMFDSTVPLFLGSARALRFKDYKTTLLGGGGILCIETVGAIRGPACCLTIHLLNCFQR
jgi:hypothetical protein